MFEGTNLSNAILEDSFAFNTHFKDVNITGTDFTNVDLKKDVVKYLCQSADGVNPVTNRKTRDTLNC